jgi:SAM-dependent methyltransferase
MEPAPMTVSEATPQERVDRTVLERMVRTRRHPSPTQFDYLHLRYLRAHLRWALENAAPPVRDVVDVYCGARPYEDLLPEGARCTGMDITDAYGVADVVSDEFLPFEDSSFDLLMCLEAFHYVPEPAHGVAEIKRVLRPGGTAIITVPLVWEYDRSVLEHRYTGPSLAHLFDGWDAVQVLEDGGRAVSWSTLTGRILDRTLARHGARRLRPARAPAYLMLNMLGMALDRAEKRVSRTPLTLPMNLLLTARRPEGD